MNVYLLCCITIGKGVGRDWVFLEENSQFASSQEMWSPHRNPAPIGSPNQKWQTVWPDALMVEC